MGIYRHINLSKLKHLRIREHGYGHLPVETHILQGVSEHIILGLLVEPTCYQACATHHLIDHASIGDSYSGFQTKTFKVTLNKRNHVSNQEK